MAKTSFRRIISMIMTTAFMLGITVSMMPPSHAVAAEYFCGSQCNGKSPLSPIASNGIICNHSAQQIASGHPTATYNRLELKSTFSRITETDAGTTVRVMYSTVCQTMWAIVTNGHSGIPGSCSVSDSRTKTPAFSAKYGCPASATTKTYPMIDDHTSPHAVVAKVMYSGTLDRAVCTGGDSDGRCYSSNPNYPVAFTYTKSY